MSIDETAFSWFARAAATQGGSGQPQATFLALAEALQAVVGHRVMTVLRIDAARLRSVRLFSSEPSYRPGGTKQHVRGAWSAAVIDRGNYFLAAATADMRAAFPDHAGIEAVGCGSIVCLPVRYDGRCLATLNLWHVSGHYDAAAAERVLPFASLLVPSCLTC
jgi:hypothetical protein